MSSYRSADSGLNREIIQRRLSEKRAAERPELERRLASAKELLPNYFFRMLSTTAAHADKTKGAFAALMSGRAGRSAERGEEFLNVVGTYGGHDALLNLYLTTGIAMPSVRTENNTLYEAWFDVKQGGSADAQKTWLTDKGEVILDPSAPKIYPTENANIHCSALLVRDLEKSARVNEHLERLVRCLPEDLLKRSEEFLQEDHMSLRFTGDRVRLSYTSIVGLRPLDAVIPLLELGKDWIRVIEWTG